MAQGYLRGMINGECKIKGQQMKGSKNCDEYEELAKESGLQRISTT